MYQFGPFSVDPERRVVSHEGTPLSVTPKVFDTLLFLVRNPDRVLTKDEFLKEVWPDTFVEEVNLAVNISTLRKALGENAQESRCIVTVPGRGYRFVASVREVASPDENRGSPDATTAGRYLPISNRTTDRRIKLESGLEASYVKVAGRLFPFVIKTRALNRPIQAALLLLVAAASAGGYLWLDRNRTKATAVKTASIAVLPFADLSPSKDQEYFSDGLADELINHLARVPGLKVVARSSAFQFKGKNEDPRSVGQKLGVTNILEGSLRREGDRVRITAELTKADDGFQLWSEVYDRKISDVITIEDEIAGATAGALQLKLLGPRGSPVTSAPRATSPESYQDYLQAQYFFDRGYDKENIARTLSYADRAIALNPKYAPAWALRSYVYNMAADRSLVESAEGWGKAREDAEQAIALDPVLAAGYSALGSIQVSYDWDWEGAEASLKKAEELEPGSAYVLRYRTLLYEALGRLDDAIETYKQAVAADLLRARSHTVLGELLYCAGQYREADAALDRSLQLNPYKEYSHVMRGKILLAQGRPQQALAEMEQDPGEFWKPMGQALAYHALGRDKESEAALKTLIAIGVSYQIAEVYGYRGESDRAFEWLDRAYQQHDGGLLVLKIDPLMANLRQDHRYSDLLRKMRLPL
jgi:TolB-like protein/DNA-binding winged helix-turn-helix (wHTH) protein